MLPERAGMKPSTPGGDGVGKRREILGDHLMARMVTFGDGAVVRRKNKFLMRRGESGCELGGVKKMEEGALGVDFRNHSAGGNFFHGNFLRPLGLEAEAGDGPKTVF